MLPLDCPDTAVPSRSPYGPETSEVAGHASLGRLSSGLGPYPRGETGAWPLLSDHISPAVLGRAGLAAGVVVQAENSCQPDAFESRPQDASSSGGASLRAPRFVTPRRRLPGMSAAEVCLPRSPVMLHHTKPGQITAFNLNPSLQLSSALVKCGGDPDLLVGEFQLAFITLLLLSSVSALDHWKSIVHLVRSTGDQRSASSSHPFPSLSRLPPARSLPSGQELL